MMLKASARAPRLPATGHARRPASLARSQSWEGGQRQSWICHSHNERAESWLCSHGERAELRPALDDALVAYDAGALALAEEAGPAIDVLGLGQAMVDMQATGPDTLLERLGVEKGARKIIALEDRTHILAGLEEEAYQVHAGGSLSNTLMALARLGAAAGAPRGGRPLRVAMAGLVGSDALGSFYAAQMERAGVEVLAPPVAGASTGTVVVLTSPDAQRTMLSYLGTPAEIPFDARLEAAIARSRVLVVEGYLWELPGAGGVIGKALALAKKHGVMTAMTAGDAGVVQRHHSEMWEAIDAGIDLLFTNRSEAEALVACEPSAAQRAQRAQLQHGELSAEAAALRLGPHCSLVCVTDGSRGSVLTALGQLHTVPPCWAKDKPVDTCGAGDAYAAGLLFGFLRGYDVATMGRVGARAASAVISQMGAALSAEAARALLLRLPLKADRQALRSVSDGTQEPAEAP